MRILRAAWALACAAFLALAPLPSAVSAAPAGNLQKAQTAPPAPGHFAGKAAITPLTQLCRDRGHRPIPGTRCPTVRNGRQLWSISGSASFAPSGPLAGDVITLQKGAVTDLASIPRLAWTVYPPDGPWVMAALFHDLCYETKGSFVWHGHANHIRGPPYTRAECDELIRQGMVALHVGAFKRVTIYEAVRLGGAGGFGH